MLLLLLLACLSFAVLCIDAAPTLVVAQPIQSQLPLIARTGSQYSWNLSSSTFVVHDDQGQRISGGSIIYNATGLPLWLSFSSSSLSFSGTVPSSASPSPISITIAGSTSSPLASISDTFELLISASKPPQLAIPLSQQLTDQNPALSGAFAVNPSSALAPYYSSATPRQGASSVGIRLLPSFDFSVGLQGGTFIPWPLTYTATLADGSQLPSWIRYDPGSFTFDGTAPDYGNTPEPFEVVVAASDARGYSAGPTARDSFWVSVATHELKVKDASTGIVRNISVGTGFILDLVDGPDDNPWSGEVFWDARFLPKDGIQSLVMNISEGTTFAFDPVSQTLSGNIQASKTAKELHGLPLAITDTQNITLNTLLVLNPVPSFFVVPTTKDGPGVFVSEEGEITVPQNFSSPLLLDLTEYMAAEGPDLVIKGTVQLSASIKPDSAKHWLSFDPNTLLLGGVVPSKDGIDSTSAAISPSSETRTGKTEHERRKHHPVQQSQAGKGQVYAALPTAASMSPDSAPPSSLYAVDLASTMSTAAGRQFSSISANSTMVNVTFSALSLDSRTISTLKVTFLLGANVTCPTLACPMPTAGGSADGADDNGRAARTGLILALVFGSLLLAAAVVACYCMRRRRRESASPTADTKETLVQDDTKQHTTGWGRNSSVSTNTDLETGANLNKEASRRVLVYSMAETKSVETSIPRGGSDGGSGSRAATPTVYGHSTNESVVNVQDALGSNSETSGSRYEYGTSIGTSYGAKAHGRTESGSGTDKEVISSAESEIEGRRLAPPSNGHVVSARPISRAPSSVTATSGTTIPKQTFFAKLRNFGPPRSRDDPSSQSSSGEEELPPKVPPKPSIRIEHVPTNPSAFTNTMAAIKESSLGSLFGLSNGGDAGTVGSKSSNHSRGKLGKTGSDKKLDIGKPRPLMPSLGAYLAKDYADQIARAASAATISRDATDDGGSGFVAGNVVIYSMENRPLPNTRPSSPQQTDPTAQPVFPAFVWPSPMQPEPVLTAPKLHAVTQISQRSVATVVRAQAKPTSLPTLLRNRSNEAAVPEAISREDSLSSSSGASTLNGDGFGEEIGLAPREVPRRRQDFGKLKGSPTDSDAPATARVTSAQHSRPESQDTVDSLAVIGTAALAVRSPLAGAQFVPSPKPSISSTLENGAVVRQSSPKPFGPSSPKSVRAAPTVKARLVQFVHEKQYDGGSSSEGAGGDESVPGAYSAYQGKREMSHKAVIEEYGSEKWDGLPAPPAIVPISSSRLAEKVKMLREQSRIYHEQQLKEGVTSPSISSARRTPSPSDEGLLNDPALILGLQYMQSFGSDGSLNSNARIVRPRVPSPEAPTGIAVGGDSSASIGSVAGRAKVLNPGPMNHRSRPRVSQPEPSFLAYENDSHSSDGERRTPPRIPLPAPPGVETQYFDLSESSSASTSNSGESDIVVHRAGQERILVGVNEPFNFPSPLTLSGFSPGQTSRTRILRIVRAAHQQRREPESDTSKSSDSDRNDVKARLWAQLEDGGKLPEWLGFDPLEAEFWGVPVPASRGSSLKVKVYFRDGQNVLEVGCFIVEVVGR